MAAVSGYEVTGIAAQQSLLLLSRCIVPLLLALVCRFAWQ